tara:strand:+ start:2690 stop:3487 length:798 start_codon:yes stop_codon:yes gene_type:complete
MNIELSFFIKKIVSLCLMPLNFSLFSLLIYWIGKDIYPKFFHFFLGFIVLFLIVCSCSKLTYPALAYLEDMYPVQNNAQVGHCVVHVLGSGYQEDAKLPAVQQLSRTGRSRLLEGLRQIELLKTTNKSCILVVSGYVSHGNRSSHANLMAQAARELGYDGKLILLHEAKDTIEEAQGLQVEGVKNVILVTSALHMHRSVQIFEAAGIQVTPAPTDYVALSTLNSALISVRNLTYFTEAWHEYIGLLWWTYRKASVFADTPVSGTR